ncbi:MAG: hypothetical protein C4540_03565 [Candidatus Omnitrophota bacterium]|jgi:hypothetical protein|nr:MAG: hypothetical protein C4540_03565 [Candidatus Omnitrophota bacterium]
MRPKEQIWEDFFRSLRASLNMLSLYSEKHPFFLNSIEDLKQKIDSLLAVISPIVLAVTSDTLIVENKPLERSGLHDELAKILHRRKIKSVQIEKEVDQKELHRFLTMLHLTPKQIFCSGGIRAVLGKEQFDHIRVEELDYSQLLRDSGEECKDVWAYLLQEAFDKKDAARINEVVDSADKIITHFNAQDFIQDKELQGNMSRLLAHLEEGQKDKFRKITKEVLKVILRERTQEALELGDIAGFVKKLDTEDVGDVLSDEIIANPRFDSLSFNVLSLFVQEKSHKEIASSLFGKLQQKEGPKGAPKVQRRLQELFSIPEQSSISEVYRKTLFSLLKEITFEAGAHFDRDGLHHNYSYMLLNLCVPETNPQMAGLILGKINDEWEKISTSNDPQYLRDLAAVLKEKKKAIPSIQPAFDAFSDKVCRFVEKKALAGGSSEGFLLYQDFLTKSSFGIEAYFDAIFSEHISTPLVISLFLKFFPGHMPVFYEKLSQQRADLDFLKKIIDTVIQIELPAVSGILAQIYSFSNTLIKIEVVRAMRKMQRKDEGFLFSVLQKEDAPLRKEALLALLEGQRKDRALALLLGLPDEFGKYNSALLENIILVEEAQVQAATPHLKLLLKRRFFWNRRIRNKAKETLEKWHVG